MEKCLDDVTAVFDYSVDKMLEIKSKLTNEICAGLTGDSSLAMIPTFVTSLPTGGETGFAYALDVGGMSSLYSQYNN
jgi:hexokinase